MSDIQIVAEIGCNHNGSVELAKKMMNEAKNAGADAVKFQSFVPENLVSKFAPKAEYQKKNDGGGSQLEMLKKLALTENEYIELVEYAQDINIKIFSTPFDFESFAFLQKIGQKIWKVPSGEITNLPYLQRVSAIECQNKEIVLSTGMSTVDEVLYAINILQQSKNTDFTVLHCNTQYPTVPEDMNLRAMNKLRELAPEWSIGLSDHSEGIIASLVAVGMGAKFIEKHFTLDKNMPGPDHKASITPNELQELCKGIRQAEIMLGSGDKIVTDSERNNIFIARKSIVAKRKIMKDEIFSSENITCKRPGNGISPVHWYEVLGQKADRCFDVDELIFCKGVKREDE
ncbi:N-acetylneuraminate synthase [Lactonifactor longoviformis]|uniref:N-acetylneuraminate synthase n=1 Tax=Lactonifactor longoviformis TaxID=341220 RepID=UPI001D0080A9|nr:N-acetylneuraminate synthase [Lactonifactor longoviformis]MCB5714971.1 N-acetylneuraminate synthase [Lactonifactor longoviformis]MCB5718925.1 N-acetylneuraminate synthase [Lactonifactor longoviformis]